MGQPLAAGNRAGRIDTVVDRLLRIPVDQVVGGLASQPERPALSGPTPRRRAPKGGPRP